MRAAFYGALVGLWPPSAPAQVRPVVDTVSATSATAIVAIVQAYQKEIANNARDAGLWHDLGMMAWRASHALKKATPSGTASARMSRLADSGLAMAAALEPDNAGYQLDMAWKLQSSNVGSARTGSERYVERALAAARRGRDPQWRAAAALELGRVHWWRFDAAENRNQFTGPVNPRSMADAMNPLARSAAEMEEQAKRLAAKESGGRANLSGVQLANALINNSSAAMQFSNLPVVTYNSALNSLLAQSKPLPGDLAGIRDLDAAATLFNEAYTASPSYPGAFRAVAATWLARSKWSELEDFAATHIRSFPNDQLAWLTLGLAQYRQGRMTAARRTFDSALVLLGPQGRDRLTSWTRTLPPAMAARLTPADRRERESLYWRTATPVWSDSTRDPRLEFLARVTHAHIRWTVEEFGLLGGDSDRGDIFIRYGPPNRIIGFGQNFVDRAADIGSFWIYPSGLMFAFRGLPTFAIMTTPGEDVGMSEDMKSLFPVKWDNIGMPRLDSVPSQIARFRANGDSVDLMIAVEFGAPDSIARTMPIAAPVARHLWIVPAGEAGERHRSAPLTAAGVFRWRERVAPGAVIYRAEAFGDGATRAAGATGVIDATAADFPLAGFAISDLIMSTRVAEIAQIATEPRRWTDLEIAPSVTRFARNQPVTFVWENYEFGNRGGQADYDVTLNIRSRRRGIGKFAAEIVGVLERMARVERVDDQVTLSFSRTVPFAAAFADWITVQLPDAPSGEYDVALTVTDRITGQRVVRSAQMAIRGR